MGCAEHLSEYRHTDLRHIRPPLQPGCCQKSQHRRALHLDGSAIRADAFLRRCFFHYIRFPDRDTLRSIVEVHYPNIHGDVLRAALDTFFQLRDAPGLKKKPSTSEFLDWLRLLISEDVSAEQIDAHAATSIPMLAGALLKNEQDLQLLERLAAVTRNSVRRPNQQ